MTVDLRVIAARGPEERRTEQALLLLAGEHMHRAQACPTGGRG